MKTKLISILIAFILTAFATNAGAQGVEIKSGGKFEFSSNATLEINNGDLINNGTITMSTETVTFSGTAYGNISGSSNIDIYSLNVNNSNGITLNGTGYFAINKELIFTSGLVNTGSNLIIIKDNATTSNASTTGYINGYCRKVGNDAFVFPIGNNGKFAPVGISVPALITDHFTASYNKSNPNLLYSITSLDAGLNNVSSNEYWMVDRTNGTSNVKVTLNWDNQSGVSLISDLVVAKWDGTKWINEGNTATTGNTTIGSITSNTISSFSPFTFGSIASTNPLPVELVDFKALCDKERVKIIWNTASEFNCDYFIIEKMNEDGLFVPISRVAGGGSTNSNRTYQIWDESTVSEKEYYRLSQVDFSGEINVLENAITFTNCNIKTNKNIEIYGDINRVNILLNSISEEPVSLVVFDISGKQIAKSDRILTPGENVINGSDFYLNEGVYIVCLNFIDSNGVAKMIVR